MRLKAFMTIVLVAALTVAWRAPAIAQATARQREAHPWCETRHDFLRTPDGGKLRTIVTRPREREGHLPAILFVGWLSCDSVALQPGSDDGWSRFQGALVRDTGAIVMRVDKPGNRGLGQEATCGALALSGAGANTTKGGAEDQMDLI